MDFMDLFVDNVDAQDSYDLFCIIMKAPVSLTYTEEKKWRAACLTMHHAYKWDKNHLQVEDLQAILTFLSHHFDLITDGHQNQEGPIQNALHVLAKAPGLDTIKSEHFSLTKTSFVCGIRHVFQGNQPLWLRMAALFFLPHLGDTWFDTPRPIMGPNRMRKLCADWASTVDGIEHTDDVKRVVLTTFLEMINSPHWHPHIITEKWKLLNYFTLLPGDSLPLRRCINNLELMDVIRNMEDNAAVAL